MNALPQPAPVKLSIADALFWVLDVETTGFDPTKDAIVELGACLVTMDDEHPRVAAPQAWLTDPSMPIPPQAKAVHHITDKMVYGKPSPEVLIRSQFGGDQPLDGAVVCVAHNAPFDRGFLEAAGFPQWPRWLCTYRLAMHLWAEAPAFGNEVLRYWLGLDEKDLYLRHPDHDLPAHRAGHDARVTGTILAELLKHCSMTHDVDELIEYANSPVVLKGLMGFGKHHDWTWAECADKDPGYLDWILGGDPEAWDRDKWHTAMSLRGRLV